MNNIKTAIEEKKNSKKIICMEIEICLFVSYIFDIFMGFFLSAKYVEIYHFVNQEIVIILYPIILLFLYVYKHYPNLTEIKKNFYIKNYSFFLVYIAFCNILTSYNINGYVLFLFTGFGLALLYLVYSFYTTFQAFNSFVESGGKFVLNFEEKEAKS